MSWARDFPAGKKININTLSYVHDIKDAIINNDPIEEYLHIIIVISNPCQYKKRYQLAKEFIEKISRNDNIIL